METFSSKYQVILLVSKFAFSDFILYRYNSAMRRGELAFHAAASCAALGWATAVTRVLASYDSFTSGTQDGGGPVRGGLSGDGAGSGSVGGGGGGDPHSQAPAPTGAPGGFGGEVGLCRLNQVDP
jgi:hypothetical protein